MWIIGKVMHVGAWQPEEPLIDQRARSIVHIKSPQDVVAVLCFTEHLPTDLEGKCVRVEAYLREVRLPTYPRGHRRPVRFQVVFEAYESDPAIVILDKSVARRVGVADLT